MSLQERKRLILKTIIENYIDTAEPVGSKTIADAFSQPISSATIRNEMSELEELGYLEKPHVSAGRIPSYSAYRLYVNELMDRYRLANDELARIQSEMQQKIREMDNILVNASRVLSELTNYTSVSLVARHNSKVKKIEIIPVDTGYTYAVVLVTENNVKSKIYRLDSPIDPPLAATLSATVNIAIQENKFDTIIPSVLINLGRNSPVYALIEKILEFIDETENDNTSEVHVEGATRLLTNREYHDVDKARALLEYLSDRNKLRALASSSIPNHINIKIGPENKDPSLKDASFVFSAYDIDEHTHGIIGIIAPTRMDYAQACAKLAAFVQTLTAILPSDTENKQTGEM